jgi:opacity protein-like surface antigen
MKRTLGSMALGAFVVGLVASPAVAQRPYIFGGGGATAPAGDFNTYAKTGWTANGGVGMDLALKGAWIEAEGFYGSNKHSAVTGDKTNVIAGFGAIGYSFMPDKKLSPYVLGGAGIRAHQFRSEGSPLTNESSTNFAYTGAAGLSYTLSPMVGFWLEGRWIGSEGTNLMPLVAGVTLHLGKAK